MAVVTGPAARPLVLIDGSQLFSAQAALAALAGLAVTAGAAEPAPARAVSPAAPTVTVLYNPD